MVKGKPHIEEKYQAELDSTEIDPFTAGLLTWGFVAILFSVPIFQLAVDIARGRMPLALEIARPVTASVAHAASGRWKEAAAALGRMTTPRYFKDYEEDVEASSIAKAFFQPRLQLLITAWAGYGNDKTTLGRHGWLFYQPGLDYLAGPDITDIKQIRATSKKMVNKQGEQDAAPDPRPAILRLAADCRSLGVRLIVMPIPDKAMMQPAQASRFSWSGSAVPNNIGYRRFTDDLRGNGVDVFDAIPRELSGGRTYYLAQDTHWTPEFMEEVAGRLAEYIKTTTSPIRSSAEWVLRERRVSRVGDLVDMLKLPAWQRIFEPREIIIHEVVEAGTGKRWEPDVHAETLLLGDSFVNIYSQPSLGWGEAAGFAEHLSYGLRQPVDVISQNGGGISGTRFELARTVNADRLLSKKLVIYQFAMRDLLGQNWKTIPLDAALTARRRSETIEPKVALEQSAPLSAPRRELAPAAVKPAPVTLVGHIVKTSRVPQPGSAPYTDCLTFMLLQVERVESGKYDDDLLLAAFWGMKNDEWLPAASYAPGDRLRLKAIPLRDADSRAQTVQRADDTDDFDHLPYFAISSLPLKE